MDAYKWKLPKCRTTQRFNLLTLLTIVGTIIYTIFIYKSLPDKIPVHFNLAGEADQWGSKSSILIIPLLLLPALAIGYAISKIPHYLHEGELTQKDKEKYIATAKYMSITNFILGLTYVYFAWMTNRISHGKYAFEPWAIYILIGALVGLWVHYGIRTKNWRKKSNDK